MKILAFADTHLSVPAVQRIMKRAPEADILVCPGDISWFGVGLKNILAALDKLNKPLYIIPGNHEEPTDDLETLCKKLKNVHYVHKKVLKIHGFTFFFWGTGGFAPRDRGFEKAMDAFKKTITKDDKVILVTHGPAFGTPLDHLAWAGHVGSQSQRKFLVEIKPVLHISGHLHEHMYEKHLFQKRTVLVNAGAAGTMIEI